MQRAYPNNQYLSEKMLDFISYQGNVNLKHNDLIVRVSTLSEDIGH